MKVRASLVLAALTAALASCSAGTGGTGGSGDTGFVSGQGAITTLAPAKRAAPGAVRGTTIAGRPISLTDYRGKVVVVNVWGSWCAPCRAEAPMLSQASRDLAAQGVQFVGIDSRDPSRAAAEAFQRRFDVGYPSIYDQQGTTLLAFRDTLAPNAVPSTVILDRAGRVASSVLGQITRTTLDDLVQEARR